MLNNNQSIKWFNSWFYMLSVTYKQCGIRHIHGVHLRFLPRGICALDSSRTTVGIVVCPSFISRRFLVVAFWWANKLMLIKYNTKGKCTHIFRISYIFSSNFEKSICSGYMIWNIEIDCVVFDNTTENINISDPSYWIGMYYYQWHDRQYYMYISIPYNGTIQTCT